MEEQEKSPEKELNEMQASNLLDIDFKDVYKDAQHHEKGHTNIKKEQSEMKNTISD